MSPRAPHDGPWTPTDLDERLEAYADRRLAPGPDQLARGRLMALSAFADGAARQSSPRGARRLRGWSLAAAVGLVLVGAGSLVAVESGPGEPFYGLRLAIGSVALPGDEPAHERGLAAQLDDRLAEAGAAARSGDGRATQAAISEYLHTLAELMRNGIGDPAILDLLQLHQVVLQEILSVAPAQATGGVQEAIDAAGHAGEVVPSTPSDALHPTPPQNVQGSPPATGRP